jgi:hypothetical protein
MGGTRHRLRKHRQDAYEIHPTIQRGITSAELLAVISTIVVHVALLSPAVQTVFKATRCATSLFSSLVD